MTSRSPKDTDQSETPEVRNQLADFAAYVALRIVIIAVQSISLERCDRLSRLLAVVFARWIPLRKGLIYENLARVFPTWSASTRDLTIFQMWHHLFLMGCEIAHAQRKIHRENWYDHFTIPDRRSMLKVVLDDRPKVLVSGHFGNFELASFLTGLFGVESTAIARPLDNRYVHNFVAKFRSAGGQHLLPKDGSGIEIQKLLDAGGTLALLADQHAGAKGCWVPFLGHLASCHKGLALFTLSSGAPMMVCCNLRTSRPLHFELCILGIADPRNEKECPGSVPALTRWYNECLEQAILVHPEQYWWVHRRWRDPPPSKRAGLAAA